MIDIWLAPCFQLAYQSEKLDSSFKVLLVCVNHASIIVVEQKVPVVDMCKLLKNKQSKYVS